MTTPQFGNCKDCAAWGMVYASVYNERDCIRGPFAALKRGMNGCWSFIPRDVVSSKVERSCESCKYNSEEERQDACRYCATANVSYWTPKAQLLTKKETDQ